MSVEVNLFSSATKAIIDATFAVSDEEKNPFIPLLSFNFQYLIFLELANETLLILKL
jgi:hypothetical protein